MPAYTVSRLTKQAGQVLLPLLFAALLGAPAAAQGPPPPKNLQVLPKDISRQALMKVMDGFTAALDVRCDHCHAQNPDNPRRLDFASDEKETKKVARVMLRMTETINQKLLPETGRADLLQVQCVTCHHGLARPQTLQHELQNAFVRGGIDTAVVRYKELREQYYGRATFDFGEPALVAVARDFQEDKNTDAAERLLNLNLEYFPKSAETYAQLAELYYRAKGDREGALKYFQKALEIDPQNGRIRRQMERLQNQD